VDDGSTDGSPAIVADEFPDVRLVTNPGNGPYEARNHGARCASADQVAFIDQDDLWHEDHLQRIDETFQAFPRCVGAFSGIAKFRDSESPQYSADECRPRTYDPWDDYPKNTLGEPVGAVMKRDAFERVGGWSVEVEGCGDYHLWLKLALVGDLAVTGCTTAGYRVHDESLSQSLRDEQVERFFARYVRASEDALERRRRRGMSTENLSRRLDAQKALLDLLRALRRDDLAGMETAIRQFGARVSDEPRSVIEDMWESLTWFADSIIERRGISTFAADLMGFTHQWPEDLRRTRDILRDWSIGRASSLDLVRRRPLEFQYWLLLVRRGLRKLRAQLKG
jgi:glycosyltransferase involved in cell wall biosynthesis